MQGRIVAPYSRDGIIAQQDEDTLVVNQQLSEWEDYVHSFYIICSSSLVSVRYVSYMYNVAYNIIYKPWLSIGLLKSVKHKNKLYRKYIRFPLIENESQYKTYKNKLNHSIRIAKRLYYEQQLTISKSNIKTTWKILNKILNKKQSQHFLII